MIFNKIHLLIKNFYYRNSIDGEIFFPVKKIKGANNSNELKDYSAYDEDPIFGILYNRLKQTDLDTKYTYSDIVAVKYQAGEKISLYSKSC